MFFFKKGLFYFYLCVHMYIVHVYTYVGTCGNQKRVLDILELKLQEV